MEKPHQDLKEKLSIGIILLGGVSLLTDISSETVFAVLPDFLTTLGAGAVIIGLVGGIEDALVGVLNLFSGHYSGKKKEKRPIVFSGYFLSACSKLGLVFSTVWPLALLFRSTDRAGKGIRKSPRDAIIASLTERRGYGFGVHRAMDTTGAIIGPLLAFLFIGLGYPKLFLLAAGIGFVALIPLFWVREKETKLNPRKLSLSLKALPRESLVTIGLITFFDIGNFTYMFLMLRAYEFCSVQIAILLYLLSKVSEAALSIPFGVLSDRVGKHYILSFGYFVFALTCIGFAFNRVFWTLPILFLLYGVFKASVDPVQRAYISDMVPEDLRPTALGTIHMALDLATLPASLIAGLLMAKFTSSTPFLYGASIGVMASVLLVYYGTRIAKRKSLSSN
ncbi:MAG TPA: MFS transporter [Thermoplasmata archaeon]|nr:MFS transporter [Thermoplasmata archaeon]